MAVNVEEQNIFATAAILSSSFGRLPNGTGERPFHPYAVKSSFLLSYLESLPEVSTKILAEAHNANRKERKFEDVVKSAEQLAVLVWCIERS